MSGRFTVRARPSRVASRRRSRTRRRAMHRPNGESQSTNERAGTSRGASPTVTIFTTTLPSFVGPGLEAFLIDHTVEISAKPIQVGGSLWATLLFSFGPGLLFIGFLYLAVPRAAQQGGGIGAGLMGIGKRPGPPLRPGEGCEGYLRRCRRHR